MTGRFGHDDCSGLRAHRAITAGDRPLDRSAARPGVGAGAIDCTGRAVRERSVARGRGAGVGGGVDARAIGDAPVVSADVDVTTPVTASRDIVPARVREAPSSNMLETLIPRAPSARVTSRWKPAAP